PRALAERRDLPAIDADDLGYDMQPEHRALHRQQRRLQDVDAVDLEVAREGDGKGFRLAADLDCQPHSLEAAERVGIAQAVDGLAAVEDDGGRADGARERTAAGLIDAANVGVVRDEVEACRRSEGHAFPRTSASTSRAAEALASPRSCR